MTTVGLPGGGTATFPDSMTPDQITAALKKQFPSQAQPPQELTGLRAAAMAVQRPIDRALEYLPNLNKMTGGIFGPPALERAAQLEAKTPYRPGMTAGQMIGQRPTVLDNPMLWAMGPGNIGIRAPASVPPGAAPVPPQVAAVGTPATRMAPAQQTLAQRGVQMTPGQAVGGLAKGFEDMATSFPILGHFITNAKGRSLESFNEATINQALEPIGRRVPKTIEAGNPSVKWAGAQASKAIGAVLDKVPSVAFDPELKVALNDIANEARANPKVWAQFEPILEANVRKPFANAGRLEGKDIQKIGSDLMRRARGYRGSQEFDMRELGRSFSRMGRALYDAIERQYPNEAPQLQAGRQSWAMLTRIEQAAGRRAGSEGKFTPLDLLSASRSQAGGIRRGGVPREFVQGDALFQRWAQAAQRVLPSKVPDSGTPSRLLAADLIGALGAGATGAFSPGTAAGMIGGTIAGGLPYIPQISRGIQNFMQRGPSGYGVLPRAGVAAMGPSAQRKDKDRELRPTVVGP